MKSKKRWLVVFLLLVISTWALYGCQSSQNKSKESKQENNKQEQTKEHQGTEAPAFTAKQLAKNPQGNWLTNGGDLANDRYSPLDKINVDNVDQLKAKWTTSLGSGKKFKYSGEGTPIVYNGVMYATTGASDVIAMDAETGAKIWEYRPHLADKLDTVCCGWDNRGVAIGDGKVFVNLLDARLVALDQKTGKKQWETKVADWKKGYTITSAPLYYKGKIYTGLSGGEYGIRGRLTAYDADSGKEAWRFYTIPKPGDKGGDTWPKNNDSWKSGGAPIWQTPSVDPELGVIYFSTGNASLDFKGSDRKGKNLFASSIVALDAKTGKYKWHFQEVHHDIWDMDAPNPTVLFDVKMDGEKRKGIAQAGKTGWVYLLDRTNGKPLVGIDEKEVPQMAKQNTYPTQPIPKGDSFVPQKVTKKDVKKDLSDKFDGKIGKIFDPFWKDPIAIKPSTLGGANWEPSAYNPDTEYFYVMANDTYTTFKHDPKDKDVNENQEKPERELWGSEQDNIPNSPSRGTVTAIDVKTNKIAWQKKWDSTAYSGVLTTKGNLVFVGHNDGRIIAYNAKNGKKVWDFQTDAGVNAPPITYKVDGKQYISVLAAGNSLSGSEHGDKIYTFTLDGMVNSLSKKKAPDKEDTPDSGDKSKEQNEQDSNNNNNHSGKSQSSAKGDAKKGMEIFKNNCLSCHGEEGVGGHNGPDLQESKVSDDLDAVKKQVANGGGNMPAFGDTLSKKQINDVAAYIKQKVAPKGD